MRYGQNEKKEQKHVLNSTLQTLIVGIMRYVYIQIKTRTVLDKRSFTMSYNLPLHAK